MRNVKRIKASVLEHPAPELRHCDGNGTGCLKEANHRVRRRVVIYRHPAAGVEALPDGRVQNPDIHEGGDNASANVAVEVNFGVLEDRFVAVLVGKPWVNGYPIPRQYVGFQAVEG